MKNKIKLIDRLKSWLLTLGIASVFGLAAFGVNAANSYQNAFAYDYEDNGDLVFDIVNNASNQDNITLFDYIFTYQSLEIFPFSFVGTFDDDDYYIDISQSTVYYDENGVWIDGNGYSIIFGFDYIFDADFDGPTTNDIVITISNTFYGYNALKSYLGLDDDVNPYDLIFNVIVDESDSTGNLDMNIFCSYMQDTFELGAINRYGACLVNGTQYYLRTTRYTDYAYYGFSETPNSVTIIDIRDNFDGTYSIDDNGTTLYELEIVFNPSYSSNSTYQSLRNYVLSYNVPQDSGNFVTALTSFMSLIGGGIVQLAQSVGAGIVSFASGLFLDSGHLSILGGIIGIFAGIALAVGITSKVYTWVSTLGN